jgi:3-oxoacyl-[acyl-carrier-protein] synthase II
MGQCDPAELLDKKTARRTDRAQQYALAAAKEALLQSGLPVTDDNAYDIGVIIGSGIGSIQTTSKALNLFNEKGQRGVVPTMVPALLSDQIASAISMEYNLRGANYTVITACASGTNAIGDAGDMIRMGRATAMVAGGAEACIIPTVLSGYDNMKALSHYDGDPAKSSRPFDLNRDGFVPGEGAAILVLEELEHAKARGATIYAELTGYGHTSDAFHVTAPREDGAAAAEAMRRAMKEANLQATDISYINAHGTATSLNDSGETQAIKAALGDHAYNVPTSSTKSMTGHMQGAAGAFEAVMCIMAIQDNIMPPTINYETPDPACDLDYIPNTAREGDVRHTLSNSFGFGGHNAVVALSRYED